MERETTNDEVQTTDEFLDGIERVLATDCTTHDGIDNVLRSYLAFLDVHYHDYITTDEHLAHCAYLLYSSSLFEQHAVYIRQQLIYCLLQEDTISILRLAVTFLLAHAREDETTYDLLNEEGTFPRLVELIAHPRENEESLHRSLMELLYEMSRIRKIANSDLGCVTDDFVLGLFDIIEQNSDDVTDPYHYPVIRVLLVLNEQFMVAAHDPTVRSQQSMPLTNKVVKVLSSHGSRYKTFGENIILLLNREDETSLQLLTLKLMYLLFTTPPTYQYFYTNDLRVLVDILVRNLLDLPEYAAALRHTYLRVLYPLLEFTQLQDPPYYKRQEIRKLLSLLCGEHIDYQDGPAVSNTALNHFEDVDETTKRLVKRCQRVGWLCETDTVELVRVDSPTEDNSLTSPEPESPTSPTKPQPPQLPAPRKLRKRDSSKASTMTIAGFLTPQLDGARTSSVSMAEMAQHKEKPGVITPSRNPSFKQGHGLRQAIFAKREKPPPPKARRSGLVTLKQKSTFSTTILPTELKDRVLGPPKSTDSEQEHSGQVSDDAVSPQQSYVSAEGQNSQGIQAPPTPSIELSEPDPASAQELSKQPPPAPKARRGWRMRKSKDSISPEEERSKEPGKFSADMPSLTTVASNPFSPSTHHLDNSPFSPHQEKSLDPQEAPDLPTNGRFALGKKSISDAMHQAHEQVLHQVEERLEGTHIMSESPTLEHLQHLPSHSKPPHHQDSRHDEPLRSNRGVIAPPGEAPIRAVPGPRVDLERSPFLSDDEDNDKRSPGEGKKSIKELTTKESWEEFDKD